MEEGKENTHSLPGSSPPMPQYGGCAVLKESRLWLVGSHEGMEMSWEKQLER